MIDRDGLSEQLATIAALAEGLQGAAESALAALGRGDPDLGLALNIGRVSGLASALEIEARRLVLREISAEGAGPH